MISKIQMAARILLGLIYFVFGGMGLAIAFGFMPMPSSQPMSEAATGFMKGIMGTGYFFPLLKSTETFGGFFLLFNLSPALALVILAPITLHIILFHAFLTPEPTNLLLPGFMGLAHILAMTAYGHLYKPLFVRK